jgi:hypothetical protein
VIDSEMVECLRDDIVIYSSVDDAFVDTVDTRRGTTMKIGDRYIDIACGRFEKKIGD